MCTNTPDPPPDAGDDLALLTGCAPLDHHLEEVLCALEKLAQRTHGISSDPPLPGSTDD